MKITLIHGENTQESYKLLSSLRQSFKPRQINVWSDKSKVSLQEFFRSQDLFVENSVYIVESFDNIKDADFKWFRENSKTRENDVVFYSKKTLSQATIKKLPPIDRIHFLEIPKIIWKFLESIYPKNTRECLGLLKLTLENEPIEKVFTLIVNQVKDLYLVKIDSTSVDYPSWRLSKLKQQSVKFDTYILELLIKALAESDIRSKTSDTNLEESVCYDFAKVLA